MLRHVRRLSGLLALMALTFSMAEGVRASVCSSMEAPPTSSVASSFEVSRTPQRAESSAPESGASHGESHHDGAGCPFGPMGMSGGCTTAVVPAESVANHPFLPEAELLRTGVERHRQTLLVHDLFRPPRA